MNGQGFSEDRRALASGELTNAWSLDEFFQALGPVMRLPPKEKAPRGPVIQPTGATGRHARARRLVALAVAIVGCAVASGPLRAALFPSAPMPEELVGIWRTTAEPYADRFFELSPDTLRLGLGTRVTSHPIVDLRPQDSPGALRYTLRYTDGAGTLEFAFSVDRESVLQIRNLPEVHWRKTPP